MSLEDDILAQMKSALSLQNFQSEEITQEPKLSVKPIEDKVLNIEEEEKFSQWIELLPKPKKKKNEFLIVCEYNEDYLVACMRELTWYEAVEIDCYAFREGSSGKTFYAGEYVRREKLSRATRWIAEYPSNKFLENRDGEILSNISVEVGEILWREYFDQTNIFSDESAAIYASAVKYFREESQVSFPVYPLIAEVDMTLKFSRWTRKELKKLTESEMSKIKLILLARQHALGYSNIETEETKNTSKESVPLSMYPEEMREKMKR